MAGQGHQFEMSITESKLRSLAAGLDPAALEALASKGLLRRAQKDLERGLCVEISGGSEGALRIKVGEFEVTLPEAGPTRATCSCPAAGVCQHILMAILFLQQGAPENGGRSEAEKPVGEELCALTREEMEKWAGKAAFSAGLRLALQAPSQILRERGLVVRFLNLNAECHCVPGGGLEGMIVSGFKADERRLKIAAVIVLQRANGVEWRAEEGNSGVLEGAAGAPRSREEILTATQVLLSETLRNGLSRLSVATQQRYATLAVSALGVNLPRLSLLLRSLGDETGSALARNALADPGRMLNAMARTAALCTALTKPEAAARPELVGWHRTRYDEVGHLDLSGVAAWPWRTASGYEGLTVLFWDSIAGCWNSWSESRPRQQQRDFNPVGRYTQPGPWEGAESPRQLAHSRLRLMNARRNQAGRLSASGKSRVLVTGPSEFEKSGLKIFTDWTEVAAHVERCNALGLAEPNPLDAIVVLEPTEWGEHAFDPVAQTFRWVLRDGAQRGLLLELRFEAFTEPAIKHLESIAGTSSTKCRLVGRVGRTPRGLTFHPHALHQPDGKIINLALDGASETGLSENASEVSDAEAEEQGEEESDWNDVEARPSAITVLLNELDDALLALAEPGVSSPKPARLDRLAVVAARAGKLEFDVLGEAARRLVSGGGAAGLLLRCQYLSALHRQAAGQVS